LPENRKVVRAGKFLQHIFETQKTDAYNCLKARGDAVAGQNLTPELA
jgi:hypothetical protein